MQILKGNKRAITLMEWNEQLEKAKKKLENSKKCYKLFGDNAEWIKEDEKKVREIKKNIKEVIDFMDKHGIK